VVKALRVVCAAGALVYMTVLFVFAGPASAHPGETDTSGCHSCATNCPDYGLQTGQYHCHEGDGAAQTNGVAGQSTNSAPGKFARTGITTTLAGFGFILLGAGWLLVEYFGRVAPQRR
jgi:hypothetical protein